MSPISRSVGAAGEATASRIVIRAYRINGQGTIVAAPGLVISDRTSLVQPWMRLRQTPDSTDAAAAVGLALSDYGLELEVAPDGRWLVVRRNPAVVAASASAPAPVDQAAPAREPEPIDEITIIGSRHAIFSNGGGSRQFLSRFPSFRFVWRFGPGSWFQRWCVRRCRAPELRKPLVRSPAT